MTLSYTELADLPGLAWGAVIRDGNARIYHGDGVERFEGGFSDGAWNGPFTAEGLAAASVVCGSAAWVTGGEIRFVTASDRLSPLFSFKKEGRIYISNSPSFLLVLSKEQLDPAYPFYHYDLVHTWRQGLFCLAGKIKLLGGGAFHIHFSGFLTISGNGILSLSEPAQEELPQNFSHYQKMMQDGVSVLLENARSALRRRPLGSIVAMSKGYDTNAIAALASKAGCREAFTYYDPELSDPYGDSGLQNAEFFKFECKELSRSAFLERPDFDEAEFAFMPLSSHAPLAGVEEELKGKVFMCGNNGDLSWKPLAAEFFNNRTEGIARFISGIGQLEYRLRVGYLLFSPSCIAMMHSWQLAKIARSDEMKPWDIGGTYNRPLARRLAEDAGLPREAFGQKKFGIGHRHLVCKEDFSPAGYERFEKFLQKREESVPGMINGYWKFRVWLLHKLWAILGTREGVPASLTRWKCKFLMLNNRYPKNLTWNALFMFNWSVNSMLERYERPMSNRME